MSIKLFFIWILANTITVASIIAAGLTIGGSLHPVVGWSVIGVSIGLIQKMLLQYYMPLQRWVWLTAVGWVIGVLLGKTAATWQAAGWDVDWAVIGLAVGTAQYFSLKKYVFQAWWWILANSTALVLAGVLGGATALLEDWFIFKGLVDIDKHIIGVVGLGLAGAVGGAVNGAVTGGWLMWLTRSRSRLLGEKR